MKATLEFLTTWWEFLAGLVAFLSAAIPAIRSLMKARRTLEATTANMQKLVRGVLEAEAAKRDPESYYTLDVHFEDGDLTLVVPMFPFHEVIVSENIRMAVIDHNKDKTTLVLRCHGFGSLPRHHHAHTCETIEVRSGFVMDIETQKRYGPGDTWVIPQGVVHSAIFQDCVCIITHKPPLPTAKQRPVNLNLMGTLFQPKHF